LTNQATNMKIILTWECERYTDVVFLNFTNRLFTLTFNVLIIFRVAQ
jgi:hypothetical protein